MATPAEEIAKQHQQAAHLVASKMPCATPTSHEEIPLSMKTRPTIDIFGPSKEKNGGVRPTDTTTTATENSSSRNIVVWSSRGHVDVTALQKLVREGYRIAPSPDTSKDAASKNDKQNETKNNIHNAQKKYTETDVQSKTNLWDPINAAVHNVHIHRPSHDAWGIGKIICIFADDFLQDIYELPWWYLRRDLRDSVQPIFDTLQITQGQVVRLLLASLPPGVTIPLHQDSGAWVKRTHRVHVPILVEHPSEVIFRVGVTDDLLERIDCTPGHVFEMNNQCRHAVSNCSDDFRVHLILDYVDAAVAPSTTLTTTTTIPRIQLEAGERLLQTRRSVDRLKARGTRPTPSFLILGAQKAGTTSLYEYMMQHPLIIKPKRRETHCLDWRWKQALMPHKKFTTEELRAHCCLFYQEAALRFHPSCCTGDSTPSYLLDSRRVIRK